jgi:steroid delta-isomerase-like uncharacterized protein
MTPEETRLLLAKWVEAVTRRDIESLMSLYTDDCVVESPTYGKLIGRNAVQKFWESIFASFPEQAYEFDDPLVSGEHVVQTVTIRGTDTGGFLGQQPTHKLFSAFVVFFFTLRGHKIVHDRRVWDFRGLFHQLAGDIKNEEEEGGLLYRATLDRVLSERELSIAAEIQRALLPSPRYTGRGYEVAAASVPCRAIGGDFFDYFELPNGVFGFALGDVSGKGPPAALLAGTIQGIFASHAQLGGGTPAEAVAHVNQVLVRRAIESRFATAVYGRLSPDGILTYCNAGHNPPFVIGRDGPLRLQEGGSILGVFKETRYDEGTVHLQPGDTLVAYSDGITEAVNGQGEEFGEQRLLSCVRSCKGLTPSDLLKRLFDEVHQFSEDTDQSDDLTALVLRYTGE